MWVIWAILAILFWVLAVYYAYRAGTLVAPAATPAKAPVAGAEKPAVPPADKPAAPRPQQAQEPQKASSGDLTAIKGIGPGIAEKLQEMGITSIEQIAGLTDDRIAEIDEQLSFKGRVEREDWVGQAKKLTGKG